MSLYETFVSALEAAVATTGNVNLLSKKTGVNFVTLQRWHKKERIPSIEAVEPLLPYLNGWPWNGKDDGSAVSDCAELMEECARLRAEIHGLRKAVTDLQLAKARLEGQLDLLKEMIGEKKPEVFD